MIEGRRADGSGILVYSLLANDGCQSSVIFFTPQFHALPIKVIYRFVFLQIV
jgi:hypothetical protein